MSHYFNVVIPFVTFPLIKPNMNSTSDKQGTGADPGLFSPGDAVKAVTKAGYQHHVQCLRGQGVLGGCVPLRSGKNAFLKLNLVHTFWQHFTEKILLG